jgi:Carboxypeptidase regulatory-like domain
VFSGIIGDFRLSKEKLNKPNSKEFCMKFKNFILAAVFLSITGTVNLQAQFNITGTIRGQVISGQGENIRRANVTVLNLQTLDSYSQTTNDFGKFRFENLSIFNRYLVQVNSRKYFFNFSFQLVQFSSLEENLTFISD